SRQEAPGGLVDRRVHGVQDRCKTFTERGLQIRIGEARFEGPGDQRLRAELEAFAVGVTDVFERGAPAHVLVYHDLVLVHYLEQRSVEAHPAWNEGLHAELAMAAAARVEIEIEPALVGTAIGELDERRRLETAPEVAVKAGARVQLENQAGHGSRAAVRLGPAVVAVGQKGIPGA